jgi:hypothetical protein
LEPVSLYEFVEVDAEKFKGDYKMLSEVAVVIYQYNVILVVRIVLFQMHEYLELDSSLMSELLLVPNDFNCDYFACFVIETFYGLAERSFAQKIQNFKPEGKMIA